jgi:hypothetical protein
MHNSNIVICYIALSDNTTNQATAVENGVSSSAAAAEVISVAAAAASDQMLLRQR